MLYKVELESQAKVKTFVLVEADGPAEAGDKALMELDSFPHEWMISAVHDQVTEVVTVEKAEKKMTRDEVEALIAKELPGYKLVPAAPAGAVKPNAAVQVVDRHGNTIGSHDNV